MLNKLKLFLFFLVFSFLAVACKTTSVVTESGWQSVAQGIQRIDVKMADRNVSYTCVKIDLETEGLEIIASPAAKDEIQCLFSLKEFARKNETIVCVNTTPFAIEERQIVLMGITKTNGIELSGIYNPQKDYCVLALSNNRAAFFNQNNLSAKQQQSYDFIISGYFRILENNQIVTDSQILRSRTACGTDKTGRYLYLLCGTPDFSLTDNNGLSYVECARILQELGCTDAIEFDGGHSSGMYIFTKSVQKPLFQRKIPAALGFKLQSSQN